MISKNSNKERLKVILNTLLEEYVTNIPETKEKYLVQKQNILYNFIVKFEPNQGDIIEFVGLLCENNETYKQIQSRL